MVLKLAEIAARVGGEVVGNGELEITGVAKIEEAKEGEITFLANRKYAKFLEHTGASAIIVPEDISKVPGKSLLRTKNPYFTFLKTVTLFYPPKPLLEKGIHKTAIIGEGAKLGKDISIGPHVVIGKKCKIGDRTILMPGVVIGDNVTVGNDCLVHANVCLREKVVIGDRVILHNGVVVGSDGFGFALEEGKYYKIPQVGTVIIEDDVEIGANSTIDRATLGETRIKKGAKLDNLIQVGHNCIIGENTVIAAQTGLSGSTKIGKGVRVGGQVGFAGHMEIGDGAAVGAQAGVTKSIPPGVMVSGYPARPHREELRIEAVMQQLPQLFKETKDLEKRFYELEKQMRKKC